MKKKMAATLSKKMTAFWGEVFEEAVCDRIYQF